MRIRVITIGLSLCEEDFSAAGNITKKIKNHAQILNDAERILGEVHGYEVLTKQIALNSVENWIPCGESMECSLAHVDDIIAILEEELAVNGIDACSIGGIVSNDGLDIVPHILRKSSRLFLGCSMNRSDKCFAEKVAETIIELSHSSLSTELLMGNRFAVSFNCPENTPFSSVAHVDNQPNVITVGLECGDLLFLAFHGVTDIDKASENLCSAYVQMIRPIQTILEEICTLHAVTFGGIDPSMNAGGSLYDSVALGIEQLPPYRFGVRGTLQSAATIGQALRLLPLAAPFLKLCGVQGLILSPLSDIVLAQRIVEGGDVQAGLSFPVVTPPMTPALAPIQPPPVPFALYDLLSYSSIGGGGLELTAISGEEVTAEQLAIVLLDIRANSCSSRKPFFFRVMAVEGRRSGEMIGLVDMSLTPSVVDTRVLAV